MAVGAAVLLTGWLVGGGATWTVAVTAVVLVVTGLAAGSAWRASRAAARETEREAEREAAAREVARRAVECAQRDLLAGMSHDLRTPLNSVIGFSSVLLRNCADRLTTQELDYLERVRANGVQLLRVVDEGLAQGAARAAAAEPVGGDVPERR